MTKHIRVENADTSDFRVVVQVWDKAHPEGSGPDRLAEEIQLNHPAAMTPSALYITNTRYLVVKEAPPPPPEPSRYR